MGSWHDSKEPVAGEYSGMDGVKVQGNMWVWDDTKVQSVVRGKVR